MKKTLLILITVVFFSNFYSTGYSQSLAIGYRVASGSFKPLDFVFDRYNPVSYTHLDGYKRQG